MTTRAPWLPADHWSIEIPEHTNHYRSPQLAEKGWVALTDMTPVIPDEEFLSLEYMDWKSGGDTNFAPIASADGELDCRGFWKPGDERPDKGAKFTSNAEKCPTIKQYVESIGADFGRVRTIKLEPQDYETALKQIHRDDNNRFNPEGEGWVLRSWVELTDTTDGYMILMESGSDGLPDPETEMRITLHKGARFVVDTQRLWHVVTHVSDHPRYALITSLESGAAVESFIESNRAN